mgnify:CR=1 FL=1
MNNYFPRGFYSSEKKEKTWRIKIKKINKKFFMLVRCMTVHLVLLSWLLMELSLHLKGFLILLIFLIFLDSWINCFSLQRNNLENDKWKLIHEMAREGCCGEVMFEAGSSKTKISENQFLQLLGLRTQELNNMVLFYF